MPLESEILWRRWLRGDRAALDRLLAYNAEDVLNMEALLDFAYPRIRARTLGLDSAQK